MCKHTTSHDETQEITKKLDELQAMERDAAAGMERAADEFDFHYFEFEFARTMRKRLQMGLPA